jgi:hypothetical protein
MTPPLFYPVVLWAVPRFRRIEGDIPALLPGMQGGSTQVASANAAHAAAENAENRLQFVS